MTEMVLTRHFSAPFSPSYSIAAFILALNSDRAEEGRELLHEREREEQESRKGGADEVACGQEGCAGCWVWSWAAEEAMSVVPFPSPIPLGLCVVLYVHVLTRTVTSSVFRVLVRINAEKHSQCRHFANPASLPRRPRRVRRRS